MLPEIFNVLFQISFHASLLLGLFYMFITGVSQVVSPNRRFTLKENSTVPVVSVSIANVLPYSVMECDAVHSRRNLSSLLWEPTTTSIFRANRSYPEDECRMFL